MPPKTISDTQQMHTRGAGGAGGHDPFRDSQKPQPGLFAPGSESVHCESSDLGASELKSVSRCSPGAITRDSVLRPSRKHGREFLFSLAPGNSIQDSRSSSSANKMNKQDCRRRLSATGLLPYTVACALLRSLPPLHLSSLGINGRKRPRILNQKQGLQTGSFLI